MYVTDALQGIPVPTKWILSPLQALIFAKVDLEKEVSVTPDPRRTRSGVLAVTSMSGLNLQPINQEN